MTKKIIILSLALGLIACGTTSKAPLDDAYYQPEKTQSTPNTPTSPTSPTSIEYLNVQDTTVTIRIKK